MGKPHPLLHTGGLPVQALRAQFPVLAQRIHGQPLAYLDNAATTQMPLAVQEAMQRFERHDRANIHRGVHTLSQRATDAFEERAPRSSASSARACSMNWSSPAARPRR